MNSNKKATRRTRDQEMAAHLVRMGIPHGRRTTATHAPPSPSMQDIGSAAYRRRIAK